MKFDIQQNLPHLQCMLNDFPSLNDKITHWDHKLNVHENYLYVARKIHVCKFETVMKYCFLTDISVR